jgi:FtsH-binding integral membrane protein
MTNPPMLYLSVCLASCLYVFARSMQQINVSKKLYTLIPVFSMLMGFLDVFIMSMIVKHATGELWIIATCLGLGGGVGSVAAVYLHDKHIKEKA